MKMKKRGRREEKEGEKERRMRVGWVGLDWIGLGFFLGLAPFITDQNFSKRFFMGQDYKNYNR